MFYRLVIDLDNLAQMSTEQRVNQSIVANRRARLRQWINEHCSGSQAQFIATTADGDKQLNQGELSGLLRAKSFGEKKARALERQAGMPIGYLDLVDDQQAPLSVREPPRPSWGVVVPAKRMAWPFHLVTHKRVIDLKIALGPKVGAEAMRDIDEQLDVVLTKWERKAASKKKSG